MKLKERNPAPLFRIILCLLILAVGVGGFRVLKNMKKPPQSKEIVEQALPVEVLTMQPANFPVQIKGYGDVVSRTRVVLSAEVSGKITFKRDQLEVGRIVKKAEILVEIDREDYQLDFATAKSLLKILTRDYEIAQAEYKRVSKLYTNKKVGSQSTVDKAESKWNGIANQLQQVRQNKERARIKLDRCVIRAPFSGRISMVDIEQDEYVNPGHKMLTLVDDSALEVVVPMDSRDAANWLQLNPDSKERPGNWFATPKPVVCELVWSESDQVRGTGVVDRIVRFDPKNRMLFVAVTVNPSESTAFPLVEGMFCRVYIPGRVLEQVFLVPRKAVNFTDSVYVVIDGRLQLRSVEVVREEGDQAIIAAGLQPGDRVITTRLENPLSNSLVRIVEHRNR